MGKPNLNRILQLGGMAAGAMYGGLPGAMMGGQLGGMVGGMAQGEGGQNNDVGNVVSRRLGQLKETPQAQIAASIESLKDIEDPMLRQELAKPLLQAQYMSNQKGYG